MRNFLKCSVLASLVMAVFVGCTMTTIDEPAKKATALTVSINESVSRTILPTLSMDPASYLVEGSGPRDASFSQSITGSSITIADLAFGAWTVTVTAYNDDGTAIGEGSTSVTVISNNTVTATVTVKPYDGFGALNLDLSWPAEKVQTAGVISTLLPTSGTNRTLDFTVDGMAGTASFSADDVSSGYHTLMLKLQDNGYTVMGAVEVVRIVAEQTTSGSLAFENINMATSTLDVNITTEMGDPLEVTISGAADTKPENQSLSLSASVADYTDNVTYVWYVNGDSIDTGDTFSFNSSWAQGYYRIDVTAYSADGKRAGSATTNVQVTEAVE